MFAGRRWRRALSAGAVKVLVEFFVLLKRPLAEQADEILAAEDLEAEQLLGNDADFLLLLCQEVAALLVSFVNDAANLMVDVTRGFLGKGLVQLLVAFFKVEMADFGRHAPFSDHGGCRSGDFVEIIRSAAGDGFEMELLRNPTAERHGHAVHELIDIHEVDVSLRKQLSISKSALTTGDDRNL